MDAQLYSNNKFDRGVPIRELAHTNTTKKYIPIWNELFFFDNSDDAYRLKSNVPIDWISNSIHTIFLGVIEGIEWYCIDISHISLSQKEEKQFTAIRNVFMHLNDETASLVAYAKGMMYWYKSSMFCGYCGNKTKSLLKGHIKKCTNKNCTHSIYPRLNPSVIVLIEYKPKDKPAMCLLNRSKTSSGYSCSTLAGFVEIGESLEDAVIREMKEEVNVDVRNIRYIASQPWPFPASLMMGFFAQTYNTNFKIDNKEIKDAKWYTAHEIEALTANKQLQLSKNDAIAQKLIEKWVLENK